MFDFSWYTILYVILTTHLTIITVTVYLHRCVAHRSLEMDGRLEHFFRFFCWLTTGQNPQEWAAVHRKHHAFCEREGDPHSPKVFGVWNIFFKGVWYYRKEASNPETIKKYGRFAPDDWIEHNLYRKYSWLGLLLLGALDVALFGLNGLWIFLIQIIWIPLWAAGVVNGFGHKWGYKNFKIKDDSTNLFPWGIIIGGEELHNNHHANPSSAKLSVKWFEFDMGWMYIRAFECLGLVKVNRVYRLRKYQGKNIAGEVEGVLQKILSHRYAVWNEFKRKTSRDVAGQIKILKRNSHELGEFSTKKIKEIFYKSANELSNKEQRVLSKILSNETLMRIHHYKERLELLWSDRSRNLEELKLMFLDWLREMKSENLTSLKKLGNKIERIA